MTVIGIGNGIQECFHKKDEAESLGYSVFYKANIYI